jgi:hypothetical protein
MVLPVVLVLRVDLVQHDVDLHHLSGYNAKAPLFYCSTLAVGSDGSTPGFYISPGARVICSTPEYVE